ncbi:NAChRalpha1 [Trichonephila clavata]|uniref:NAChRalpha1 n=1 Tax=Trichonephila clavata TaxID=2740835 RepID=A0A8X6H9M9_TRICU|nr:NAChRalpha1 [Trichonephila clavata]
MKELDAGVIKFLLGNYDLFDRDVFYARHLAASNYWSALEAFGMFWRRMSGFSNSVQSSFFDRWCGRELRSDHHDEGHPALRRESDLEASRHLQELLRDRRRVLPLRRTDLPHEVRILDLRRIHGGLETQVPDRRIQSDSYGHGSQRVLLERRVGHYGGPSASDGEVLQLLRRALSGHHLQHHPAPENPLLHRQPHHPLRIHLLSLGPRLLPAFGLGRKSVPLHLHRPLPGGVLPAVVGDHPPDVSHSALTGEVPALHHDPGFFFGFRHHCCAQCQLQLLESFIELSSIHYFIYDQPILILCVAFVSNVHSTQLISVVALRHYERT